MAQAAQSKHPVINTIEQGDTDMKSYLAAYAVGIALTAATVGFGAAAAHASDLQTAGYPVAGTGYVNASSSTGNN